jgi:class 3 adenylate cyclase
MSPSFMGDGVLAYFGWPRAHEDEAERAVRAGLAVVAAVARLSGSGQALACRVGRSPRVPWFSATRSARAWPGSRRSSARGPNLAARLQVLAGPGGMATVFLASDAASYVTGAVLFADDERTAIDGRFTPPPDVSPRASAAAAGGAFTTRP